MKILTILFVSILIFSTSLFAAKKYPHQGEWKLIKQTNCSETISKLIIKKKNVKTSEKIKGKIFPKKNTIKLGNIFKGEFSGESLTLFSTKDDCVQEYASVGEPLKPVPNAPEGWFFGTEQDGEWDTPFFAGWVGGNIPIKSDIRWSENDEPVRVGEKSIRFYIGRGEKRCEPWSCPRGWDQVTLDDGRPKRHDELSDTLDILWEKDFWYAFSLYVPKDFQDTFDETRAWDDGNSREEKNVLKGRLYLFDISAVTNQCFDGVDNINIAEVAFDDGQLILSYFGNNSWYKYIKEIDEMRGKWTDFLININYDLEDGYIYFYIDGEEMHAKDHNADKYDEGPDWYDPGDIFEPDNYFFEASEDFWDEGDSSVDECDYLIYTTFGGRRPSVNKVSWKNDIKPITLFYDEVRIGNSREEVDMNSNPDLVPLN
jgi:hypothetical protein